MEHQGCLGLEVCKDVILLHSGKGTSLKKFKSSKHFQEQAKVFAVESATLKDISAAGEQVLVNVYNGTSAESLDYLCYKRFCEKVATNTMCIHLQTLPPTSSAAKYHSLHVYFQIQEWKGCSAEMQPLEWGRKKSEGKLMQYSLICHLLQMNS